MNENISQDMDSKYNPLFSRIGVTYEDQRMLWLWCMEHKDIRGVGWRTISKNICARNNISWDISFTIMIENWARNKGSIYSRKEYDLIKIYSDSVQIKNRERILAGAKSADIEAFFAKNIRLDIPTSGESGDLIASHQKFAELSCDDRQVFVSGISRFGSGPAECSLSVVINSSLYPNVMRIKFCFYVDDTFVIPPLCGLICLENPGNAVIFLWDLETFSCINMECKWSGSDIDTNLKISSERAILLRSQLVNDVFIMSFELNKVDLKLLADQNLRMSESDEPKPSPEDREVPAFVMRMRSRTMIARLKSRNLIDRISWSITSEL